jgi:hypothetical protein
LETPIAGQKEKGTAKYTRPRSPWLFLDTYAAFDEFVPVDAFEAQKGSDAQLVSYLE